MYLQIRSLGAAFFVTALLALSPAHAALQGRTINGSAVGASDNRAVFLYDTDLGITWLRNANAGTGSIFDNGVSNSDGKMSWGNANAWADSLTTGGFTNWRLPDAHNANGGICQAQNCSGSEIGHLWYTELGNTATAGPKFTGSFNNLQDFTYWTSTGNTGNRAWAFDILTRGVQFGTADAGSAYFALAVRTGDVLAAAVPEPASYALLMAGLGLMGAIGSYRHRQQ